MRSVLLIAGYEIRRALRPKDFLWTILISVFLGLAFGFFGQRSASRSARDILVSGPLPTSTEQFAFEGIEDPDEARERVRAKRADAWLDRRSDEGAILVVRKGYPTWKGELDAALTLQQTQQRAAASGLAAEQLAELFAPFQSEVESLSGNARKRLWGALIVVLAMVMGLFGGSAQLFTGITGEKRRRVTETVIAIVPPQTWIDGKLLGLGVVAGMTLVHFVVGSGTFFLVNSLFGELPTFLAFSFDPLSALPVVALALPGFAFWFCLVAAFCATINDPETSARGSILLLPPAALGLPLVLLKEPESSLLQVLSWLPPTSPSALTMRWILDEVALWEWVLALALLLLSVHALRVAAGRIFAMSMLLHGSEPSLGAMWRAARQAR